MPHPVRRALRSTGSSLIGATATSLRIADTVVTRGFKVLTTDHLGVGRHLMNMPALGFWGSLSYIAMTAVATIIGAVVTGGLWYLIIAYGIPALFDVQFSW